jgi:hypothetical protein
MKILHRLVITFLCLSQPAFAYTQCDLSVQSVFSGDDGFVWVTFTNNGSGYLSPTDPDKQATMALAMTALVSSRPVTVRYTADGVPCTSQSRSDLIGFYLK